MGTSKQPEENSEDVAYLYFDKNTVLDRMKELVRLRLVESGWREQVRLNARKALSEMVAEQRNPTVAELVRTVTPRARSLVPDAVKRELLQELEISFKDQQYNDSSY